MMAARSQQVVANRNADVEVSRPMGYRVGINSGAVIWDDACVYGDDVNIAVRLQSAVAGLLRRCNEPVRRPRAYGLAQQGGADTPPMMCGPGSAARRTYDLGLKIVGALSAII